MYERVVVPLDGSEHAEVAVGFARAVAWRSGAGLWLVSVLPDGAATAERGVYLQSIAEAVHDVPIAEVSVEVGRRPAEVIASLVGVAPGSIVCMATHGHGAMLSTVLGSVATEVVRRVPGPILLAGPRAIEAPSWFNNVVAAVDGSSYSESIVPVAAKLASFLGGARLHLVQVLSPDIERELRAPGLPENDVTPEGYVVHLARELADEGTEAEWAVLHDSDVARAVAGYAETVGSALVAMSTHGRSGISRLVFGSVAADIVHRASGPVLVQRLEPEV